MKPPWQTPEVDNMPAANGTPWPRDYHEALLPPEELLTAVVGLSESPSHNVQPRDPPNLNNSANSTSNGIPTPDSLVYSTVGTKIQTSTEANSCQNVLATPSPDTWGSLFERLGTVEDQDGVSYPFTEQPDRTQEDVEAVENESLPSPVAPKGCEDTPVSRDSSNIISREARNTDSRHPEQVQQSSSHRSASESPEKASSNIPGDITGEEGWTALHLAAAKGAESVLQLLLAYGADPNQRDSLGRTVLHLAVHNGHRGIVQILLRHGRSSSERTGTKSFVLDVNLQDNDGRTPLHAAVLMGREDMVSVLLNASEVNIDSRIRRP